MTDRPPPAWRRLAPWASSTPALPAAIAALLRLKSQTRLHHPMDPLVPAGQLRARVDAPIALVAGPPRVSDAHDRRGGDP